MNEVSFIVDTTLQPQDCFGIRILMSNLRSPHMKIISTPLTSYVYKSFIMVVENFQKYHWIQHKNAQPVVMMTKRNKLL